MKPNAHAIGAASLIICAGLFTSNAGADAGFLDSPPIAAFDEELHRDPDLVRGCPCDIAEPFGVLDLHDVAVFVNCFTSRLPCGDIAPAFGTWDLNDISLFISCFISGC